MMIILKKKSYVFICKYEFKDFHCSMIDLKLYSRFELVA